MKNVYFIYNPHSGKGKISSKIVKIIDKLTQKGYEVTIHPTQARNDACSTVKRILDPENKSQYDMIICSGGDGTLNEVIQGLMVSENRVPVGYIPSGSTNDFARSLKIPKETEKALDSIITGTPTAIDIGSFNESYFTYVAAFGALTEVSYETPQGKKNLLGHSAYILEGVKHLSNIQSYNLTIECNGITITGDFILGLITNTASVAGLLSMGDFSYTDGLYEVTLIRTPNSPAELQSIIGSILNIKQAINTEYVTFFKTNEIHIKVNDEKELYWTIDGEAGGDQRNVKIWNNKQALDFIVPKNNHSKK